MSRTVSTLAVMRRETPEGLRAIPVRTRLVRPGDDLIALVAEAVSGIARPGDVVAVSETALAIAQGEFVVAERVRPSKLAYVLCRNAGPMATISQPESMQLVIDRVGYPRAIYATVLHLLGRLVGRRGVFYELMGAAVAAFDGYTGTMPPYERAIVFAPRDPDAFAREFERRSGIDCAIVDANDLEKAKILGASDNVCAACVEGALLDNPHGNSDEQTPVVVLKWRGSGDNPLLSSGRRSAE
ncbi:MAG TPA: coenzyme F420-0:L-glutamate ligase [Candidatus Cybelea sp.]|nr:coenzyme F420-0:L-glutamate ligase [Candidatus Cybelea sp.]